MNEIEIIRKKFKPKDINILFVGESNPAGGTFFYLANSILFKAVKAAFTEVYGNFNSDAQFLSFFKSSGCYLDDLCLKPINHLTNDIRKNERTNAIPSLSNRIKIYQPKMIAIVMKAIQKEVFSAIRKAEIETIESIEIISFPAGNETNRMNCISETEQVLKLAISRSIINGT